MSKSEDKPEKRGLITLTREEVERAMKKFEEEMKDDSDFQEQMETSKLQKKEAK